MDNFAKTFRHYDVLLGQNPSSSELDSSSKWNIVTSRSSFMIVVVLMQGFCMGHRVRFLRFNNLRNDRL